MNTEQGDFYVALNDLRTSIEAKIDRVDSRQRDDLKTLKEKNDKWQDEVRDEFTDVKSRLDIIETKVETKEADTQTGSTKLWAVLNVILVAVTAYILYIHK